MTWKPWVADGGRADRSTLNDRLGKSLGLAKKVRRWSGVRRGLALSAMLLALGVTSFVFFVR